MGDPLRKKKRKRQSGGELSKAQGRDSTSNKKKKKARWRDRHQAYVNQLPYHASEPEIRAFLNQVCKENFTIKRVMQKGGRTQNHAVKVRKGGKKTDLVFSGQAFITFKTRQDLDRALTLDKSYFYDRQGGKTSGGGEPASISEGAGENDDEEKGKKKKKLSNTMRKASRYPVNVVEVIPKKELREKKQQSNQDEKKILRPKEEVLDNVGDIMKLEERGLGLAMTDIDDGVVEALRRVSEEVARNALLEFDVLGPLGKNKLQAVKNRPAYLSGIVKKWQNGEGNIEDTKAHVKRRSGASKGFDESESRNSRGRGRGSTRGARGRSRGFRGRRGRGGSRGGGRGGSRGGGRRGGRGGRGRGRGRGRGIRGRGRFGRGHRGKR